MDLKETSKGIRKKTLEMVYDSKTCHLGSCFSCIDILTVLYFKIMRLDPKNPLSENRDRFILSKGHAVACLYAILAEKGFFPKEILADYCKDGKKLAGHATKGAVPGIDVSTGSLGHGLSIGAGMALALKNKKEESRVFVLLSDGDCQEGATWEAMFFAKQHKLDNLVAIVDRNKLQGLGGTEDIMEMEPFLKKWESFGWLAKEIDGHNLEEMERIFSEVPFEKGKPTVVIAKTIKGKGVSFLENKFESHYKHLEEEDYKKAINELEK